MRAAAEGAAARNERLASFRGTSGGHGQVLVRDAGPVAAAIEDVAGRSIRRPGR